MDRSTAKRERNYFFLVTAVSCLVRLIRINMPILEGTVVRQVQTASISRFFFNHGVDIFHSQLDHVAGDPGYLILEFPLYNVILTAIYRLAGGVHEYLGRLLSIFFFIGAGIFLYLLLKKIYDSRVALWGFIAFNFSPLGIIFSRAIMPDSEMLFFSTGAIFFMLLYSESGMKKAFWLSALWTMLSLLVKVQSFYILVPLLFLVFLRQGKKVFFDVKNYVFGAIALIPTLLWYSYGSQIHRSLSPERIANYSMSNWFAPGLFLSMDFYKDIFTNFAGTLLTPVGFVLFLLGIMIRPRRKNEIVLYVWLLGTVLFGIVFCALLWEPYYYLLFLPPAAVFIARVFTLNWTEIYENSFLSTFIGKAVTLCIIMIIIARYAIFAYMVPAGYSAIPELAETVRSISSSDDKIVVAGENGTSAISYYSGRKGWGMVSDGLFKDGRHEDLAKYRMNGAEFLVSIDRAVVDNPEGIKVEDPVLELIRRDPGRFVIYKMKKGK